MHKKITHLNVIFDEYDIDSIIVCSRNNNSCFLRSKHDTKTDIVRELKAKSIIFNSKCTLLHLIDEYLISKNILEYDIIKKYHYDEYYIKLSIFHNTTDTRIHDLFYNTFIISKNQINTDLVKSFIKNDKINIQYRTELIVNNYRVIYKQMKVLKNHSTIHYEPWAINFILENNLRSIIFNKLIPLLSHNPHYITICHCLSFCVNAKVNWKMQWICNNYPLNINDFNIKFVTIALEFFKTKTIANNQFNTESLVEKLQLIFNSFDPAKHVLSFFE